MGFEIVNSYLREFPALRFIGKKYEMSDMNDGSFSAVWEEWDQAERFDQLMALSPSPQNDMGVIGFIRWKGNVGSMTGFEYWVGMFFDEGKDVPEGFASLNLPASQVGITWIKGQMPDIFGSAPVMASWKVLEEKYNAQESGYDGWKYEFELYNFERFNEQLMTGENCVLDYGFYIN
ncbi:hypothetical protein OfM1_20000 [Lactovum odontotermitis]